MTNDILKAVIARYELRDKIMLLLLIIFNKCLQLLIITIVLIYQYRYKFQIYLSNLDNISLIFN